MKLLKKDLIPWSQRTPYDVKRHKNTKKFDGLFLSTEEVVKSHLNYIQAI